MQHAHHRVVTDAEASPADTDAAAAAAAVSAAPVQPPHDAAAPLLLSYDDALTAAGTGAFTRRMTALLGLANAADAVELLSISLVLPAVGPDGAGTLRLSLTQLASLSGALFWGALVGTLAAGVASDALGRRTTLVASMALNGTFGLLSSAATSFGGLVFCRVLCGVGVGGSVPVVFAFLAELLPLAARGRYMCALASCWMVGSLATALAGLALVPRHPVAGWRAFLAVAAMPSLACALLTWRFAPESPRYLLVRRRPGDAMRVLRAAAAANGRPGALPPGSRLVAPPAPRRRPYHPHGADDDTSDGTVPPPPPVSAREALRVAAADAATALRAVLSPPLRATTLRMAGIWFGISWGWYGTIIWMPEFFKRRGEAAGPSAAPAGPTTTAAPPPAPPPARLDARPFVDQVAIALANLPGNAASIALIDKVGRRTTLAASLAAGALAALCFAAVPRRAAGAALAAACAFNGASVGAWNALDTYSAELLPTAVRTTGLGLLSAAGRLGAIAAQASNGILLNVSLAAPLLPSAAIMLAAAGIVVFKLPTETTGRPLADDVGDDDDVTAAAAAPAAAGGEDDDSERAALVRRHKGVAEVEMLGTAAGPAA